MCEVRFFFFLTSCQINFSQRVKFVKRLFKHCAHVFIRYHLHDIKSLQIQILMLSKKKIKSASLERLSLMMFARGIGIIMRICSLPHSLFWESDHFCSDTKWNKKQNDS